MKLFIDSAVISEIEEAASWGVLNGVTTNPTLIRRAGGDLKKTIQKICGLVNGPVSVETVGLTALEMFAEGKEFAKWHKNVNVKVPCTSEGIKAVGLLKRAGIKTNVTLVFSANQVLLAAKAGADLISPFVGRLNDAGENGMDMVRESVAIIENYNFSSELLVASIRSARMVTEAAVLGAHIATVPFKVLQEMFTHTLTDKGIEIFLKDWGQYQKKA